MVAIPSFLLATAAVRSLISPDTTTSSKRSRSASSYRGPLVDINFADPSIIHVNGTSYAFATNNRGIGSAMIHVQVATSKDNKTWDVMDKYDALPQVGAWEAGNRVWGPDIVQLNNGNFVMYYSDGVASSPGYHCVGAATSDHVLGPYKPSSAPFACPDVHTLGGAIDPDGFHDTSTGRQWVVYKTDGNSNGHGGKCQNTVAPIVPTPIMLQEVSAEDGITRIGQATQILDRDAGDGPLIEAPAIHRSRQGTYFLFFSSNCFTTPFYDTSYATAPTITGPYIKSQKPLIVSTNGPNLIGPGGLDIVANGNLVVFHGHLTPDNDKNQRELAEQEAVKQGVALQNVHLPFIRGMYSARLHFSGSTVTVM